MGGTTITSPSSPPSCLSFVSSERRTRTRSTSSTRPGTATFRGWKRPARSSIGSRGIWGPPAIRSTTSLDGGGRPVGSGLRPRLLQHDVPHHRALHPDQLPRALVGGGHQRLHLVLAEGPLLGPALD